MKKMNAQEARKSNGGWCWWCSHGLRLRATGIKRRFVKAGCPGAPDVYDYYQCYNCKSCGQYVEVKIGTSDPNPAGGYGR